MWAGRRSGVNWTRLNVAWIAEASVRTASVWQVREPVYRKSSGRWQHYERQLEPARRMLAGASV